MSKKVDLPSEGPYETETAAKRMLVDCRFASGFSSPGRPELWINLEDHNIRKAVAEGDEDGLWYIVDYPEPAVCVPSEVKRLAEEADLRRAGILL